MSMIDDYEDYCEVWPEPTKKPEDESRPLPTFAVDVHLSFVHPPSASPYERDHLDDDDDDYDEELEFLNGLEETPVEVRSFEVERNRLINNVCDNVNSTSALEEIFQFMQIPCKPFMIEKILACANAMAKNYQNYKVLRIRARISMVVFDDQVGMSTEESMDDDDMSTAPASESSLAKLETVEVDYNQGLSKRCAICLEDMPLGSQGTRMPCSHLFHGGCIVNWLRQSRYCPLCRFEMN